MKLHLVGGFLGSGKTTAIRNACMHLQGQNKRVAVVTNDQGEALVDTKFLKSSGIPSGEVLNGCFCCNYAQLEQSVAALSAAFRPEIVFAESVGSCADLVATVAKPFSSFHADIELTISVFADAELMHAIISGQASFLDDRVQYIYKKQLAEADMLVINKTDLLAPEALAVVRNVIETEYSRHRIIYQNSHNEESIGEWLTVLDAFRSNTGRKSLEIDYDVYGAGEAKLAWYDAEIEITTDDHTAFETTLQLVNTIHTAIEARGQFIAHLKFLLDDGFEQMKISATANRLDHPQTGGSLRMANKIAVLVNARVQAEPDLIEKLISTSIEKMAVETGSIIDLKKKTFFKPGFPVPTYRFAD